jgi:branched-chain amino acid transport system permease protein
MAEATASAPSAAQGESPIKRHANLIIAAVVLLLAVLFPFTQDPLGTLLNNCILALAYVVMALGLNIVVGFAGLLDLGYVAFYALGAYSMGWLASDFYSTVNGGKGVFILVGEGAKLAGTGIHINFLLILVVATALCALFGMLIGLPTLRLRGDYIAIVTLAFGEIIYRFAANGDTITFGSDAVKLTNGRQAICVRSIGSYSPWPR